MELFFSEHWQIVTGFISMLLVGIGFLIKNVVSSNKVSEKELKTELKTLEAEVKNVKDNYLDRFERVFEKLAQISLDIEKVHSAVNAQKSICEAIQEAKR